MKNTYFTICFLVAITAVAGIFTACKKEKSDTLSSNSIVVAIDPIRIISFDIKGPSYEYSITGKIIAPRKVKVQSYGYIISPGGVSSYTVDFPATELIGNISINRTSSVQIIDGNVVFYVVLENGETVRSDGVVNATDPKAFNAKVTSQSWNGTGTQNFTASYVNNNSFYWSVTEYGFEYMADSIYPGGAVVNNGIATGLDYHTSGETFGTNIDPPAMQIGITYWYRPYIKFHYVFEEQTIVGPYKKFTAE